MIYPMIYFYLLQGESPKHSIHLVQPVCHTLEPILVHQSKSLLIAGLDIQRVVVGGSGVTLVMALG